MPRPRQRKLPSAITAYIRVLSHRIRMGEIVLPISIYLSPSGNRISTVNKLNWNKIVTVEDVDLADFEILYSDVETAINSPYRDILDNVASS
jgi:hypothetical protein